jgi:hypothetical protein
MFQREKPLWANVARLINLAALAIGFIQRNGKTVEVRATGDLAENQVRAWKISNHKSRSTLSAIGSRKRNDNDFAGYRFDHAASSSGEFQSRARTDSLSSAPLNRVFSSPSFKSPVSNGLSTDSGISDFILWRIQSIAAENAVQHCFVDPDLIKQFD